MVFGVIIWVALAAIFPTMVVPTIQHAVAPSSMPAAHDTPDATAAPAAPGMQPKDATVAPQVSGAAQVSG
ncbi:hypothetical protein [Burkholderia sp. PU8-34]